ncbi:MAG: DUF3467 domain-containing protein [Phycisphaerae bacterium]|nr:DUF3467 domain-containing protein [Phycisphaerae bacterium]
MKKFTILIPILFVCAFYLFSRVPLNTPEAIGSQVTITLDDSGVLATYANHVEVKDNPEEIIFDFALWQYQDTHKNGTGRPFKRIVLNYYTAKRLLAAIEQTIERHERNFGVIETNPITTDDPNADSDGSKSNKADNSTLSRNGYLLIPHYSNFCRVTGTPEEVIVDFVMNSNPFSSKDHNLIIEDRIILNYSTAKHFLRPLKLAVLAHEKNYGNIELDVTKRVKR